MDSSADRANLQYNALYSGDIAIYRRRFGGQCLGLGPHQAIEWTDNRGKKENRKRKEKPTRYFTSNLPQNDSCLYVVSRLHPAGKDNTVSKQSHAPFFIALESASANREQGEQEGEEEEGWARELTTEVFVSQKTAKYNRALQEDPRNVRLWLEFITFQSEAAVWGGVGKAGTTGKVLRAINERKLAIFERALEHNPTSEELLVGHLELLRDVGREPEAVLRQWRDLVFRMPNKPLLWLKYSEFYRAQFSTFSTSSLSTLYQKGISTLTVIQEGVLKSHSPEPDSAPRLLALFVQHCYCLAAAGQSERALACYQALLEYNLCCPLAISSADGSTIVTHKQKIAFFEPFWDSGAPRLGEEGAVGWSQWMQASQSGQTARPLSLIDAYFLTHPEPPNTEGESEDRDPELALISGQPLPEAWLHLESYRQQHDALPYRGSDDDLTDPERAVLFEDISQCMFTVDDSHLLLTLILQFLQFLGVCIPGAPSLDRLPHLLSSHLHCALDALPTSMCSGTSAAGETRLAPSPLPYLASTALYHHSFCGVASAYSAVHTTHLVQGHQNTEHPSPPPAVCRFISTACNQLLSLLSSNSAEMQTAVALAWIGFELFVVAPAVCDPAVQVKSKETKRKVKGIQKLVKSLLKLEAHRNNLALWDCCAQLELLLVGSREARLMYETVLSQYTVISPGLVPLYQHYCELLMGVATPLSTPPSSSSSASSSSSSSSSSLGPAAAQSDFYSRALQVAACVAEGKYSEPPDQSHLHTTTSLPSHILRVRRLFEQRAESDSSRAFVFCHAYFEYLSRDLQSACKVFERYTSSLKKSQLPNPSTDKDKHRTLQADLHCAYHCQTRLLLHHAEESRPMPPSLLWSTLEQALASFPDDPYFLSAYTDCQQPLYLMGKLRRYFDTSAPKAQTALPWIHAVRAEVGRYQRVREVGGEGGGATEAPVGLVNRIRAILSRATQSANGRVCPLLWRLAISFEVLYIHVHNT